MSAIRIPALFMRGGTSKGVFFLDADLPADPNVREAVMLRVIGSPDPYERHIDGMGGATSSTSKVVVIGKSMRPNCDVDYWFGAVAIREALLDASGNCGNLSAAVGPFAIHSGLVKATVPNTAVRIWQANLGKMIIAHVPVHEGQVVEDGDFCEDGVAFPAAPVVLEFIDPGDAGGVLPTGHPIDQLGLPDGSRIDATLVNAGNPTVFVRACDLGLGGSELPVAANADAKLLGRLEAIRACAAVEMGLADTPAQASRERPATPKVSFVAPPAAYRSTADEEVATAQHDLRARIVSMGRLHHAYTGTGAIALSVAGAIPGTLVAEQMTGGARGEIRIGHPAGTLVVGADVGADLSVHKVVITRSARVLMSGHVHVPSSTMAA